MESDEAEAVLRHYASEIEADLGLRGIDIGAWHRGEMSGRHLLSLIEHLPESSAFKTAARGGDWTFDRYVMVAILNEMRALRADLRALLGGQEMDFEPLLSPRQEADRLAWLQSAKFVHENLIAQMRGENHN